MDDTRHRIEKQKTALRAALGLIPKDRRTGVLHSMRADARQRLNFDAAQLEREQAENHDFLEQLYERCNLFNETEAGRRLKARKKYRLWIWWLCTLVFSAQLYLSSYPAFDWMNRPGWLAVVMPLIAATYVVMLISVVRDLWCRKQWKREEIQRITSTPLELPQIVLHAVDELLEEHYQS
ncbi:MAG: hypothetical protein AWU57_794 [Marinobacter sp. T13-3]|nr:MAG: hypothetical protein AWU57_794 [Marinobacter sp. T13-3]